MTTTDIFADFQQRYKYRILGTYNTSYANLSGAIGADSDIAKRLKTSLTNVTIKANTLQNSGADADTMSKENGQAQIGYLRSVSSALYNAKDDSPNLSSFRASLYNTSTDLEKSINEYLKSTTRTAADDATFLQNAQYVLRKLSSSYVTAKGLSAAEGVRIDHNMTQANKKITALRDLLNNFPAAGASAAAAAPAAAVQGGDDGTINGTSSAGGETVDFTA